MQAPQGSPDGGSVPSRSRQIKILIVAGVRLYQDGLARALGADARFSVVGTAGSTGEGLERIAVAGDCPDVALLDISPPAGFDGARALRAGAPGMRILALGVSEREEDVIGWAEAGVSGFVTRDTPLSELMQAVESVVRQGSVCSPMITNTLLRWMESTAAGRPADPAGVRLTRRERQIVALIDDGLSNKEIARELQLSLATVKNHVHAILEKLQVGRRGEAAAAMRGS